MYYILVWVCYERYHINVLALLDLSYSPHKYGHNPENPGEIASISQADPSENRILLRGIWALCRALFSTQLMALLGYWGSLMVLEKGSPPFKFLRNAVCVCLYSYTLLKVFGPSSSLGQTRMHSTLKRILVGNINSATMRTNDILVSDSLTSYAKIINDMGVFFSVTFASSHNYALELVILCIPGLIRIKQCWLEYRNTRRVQHIMNLLKYTAQLVPLLINMLIKRKMLQLADPNAPVATNELNFYNRWWYVFSAISSTYSFIWDVKMDWGFGLVDFLFGNARFQPLRQRDHLVFNSYLAYFFIIATDCVLRYLWVLKLFVIKETELELTLRNRVSNFLFGYDYLSFGYFALEVMELVRRWLWCFLKLECDLVKLPTYVSLPLSDMTK